MAENANHPPIPPDCGYFRQGDSGTWHFVPCGLGNGSVALDAALSTTFGTVITEGLPVAYPGPWWGPIIAAVAEVAWLREAERVGAKKYETALGPMIIYTGLDGAANDNARAWREWGEANAS